MADNELVRLRYVTVDVEIPSSLRYLYIYAVMILRKYNLTTQPGRWFQAEGHVQHVLLVLAWLRKGVVKVFV